MKNLSVGNLSLQTTDAVLQALFEPFGEIARAQVMTHPVTGRSRGFGFVEMTNDAEADKAIEALNGKQLDGRALNVNEAQPKNEQNVPRSGGGGYGSGRPPQRESS